MNTTLIKKYFIISLPRTGTKSLCKMASILGFTYKHVPSTNLPRLLRLDEAEVFADTPVYCPSVFKPLAEDENNYFIYIDRAPNEWVDSFERVNMNNNYMALHGNKIDENGINKLDRASLEEIFFNEDYSTELALKAYDVHRNEVMESIPSNRLLIYNFSLGWKPLCDFMGVDVPDQELVPHINKNQIYEKIEEA